MPLTRHRGRAAHYPSALKWGLMLNNCGLYPCHVEVKSFASFILAIIFFVRHYCPVPVLSCFQLSFAYIVQGAPGNI